LVVGHSKFKFFDQRSILDTRRDASMADILE
jgi:hypothetical protein